MSNESKADTWIWRLAVAAIAYVAILMAVWATIATIDKVREHNLVRAEKARALLR
jgi:hypothetical protein